MKNAPDDNQKLPENPISLKDLPADIWNKVLTYVVGLSRADTDKNIKNTELEKISVHFHDKSINKEEENGPLRYLANRESKFNEKVHRQIPEAQKLLEGFTVCIKSELDLSNNQGPVVVGMSDTNIKKSPKEIQFRDKIVHINPQSNSVNISNCTTAMFGESKYSKSVKASNGDLKFGPIDVLNQIIREGTAKKMQVFDENETALNEIMQDLLEENVPQQNHKNYTIDLNHCGIYRFPESYFYSKDKDDWKISALQKIKHINLDNNQLQSLPRSLIKNCPNLQTFSCKHNQLNSIPPEYISKFGQAWENEMLKTQVGYEERVNLERKQKSLDIAQVRDEKPQKLIPNVDEKEKYDQNAVRTVVERFLSNYKQANNKQPKVQDLEMQAQPQLEMEQDAILTQEECQIQEAKDLIQFGIKGNIQSESNFFGGASIHLNSGYQGKTLPFRNKTLYLNHPYTLNVGSDLSMSKGKVTRQFTEFPKKGIDIFAPHGALQQLINEGVAKHSDIFNENEQALEAIVLGLLETVKGEAHKNIHVNLSNSYLHRLPEALFYSCNKTGKYDDDSWKTPFWNEVTEINLNGNKLQSIPDFSIYCPKLRSFSCEGNQLESLPEGLVKILGEEWKENTLQNQIKPPHKNGNPITHAYHQISNNANNLVEDEPAQSTFVHQKPKIN